MNLGWRWAPGGFFLVRASTLIVTRDQSASNNPETSQRDSKTRPVPDRRFLIQTPGMPKLAQPRLKGFGVDRVSVRSFVYQRGSYFFSTNKTQRREVWRHVAKVEKKFLDDNKSKNGGTNHKNRLTWANQQPSRFLACCTTGGRLNEGTGLYLVKERGGSLSFKALFLW